MRHVVFIVDKMFPQMSTNANCIYKIAVKMSEKYRVSMLSQGDRNFFIDNNNIYHFSYRSKLVDYGSKYRALKKIYILFFKIFNIIFRIFGNQLVDKRGIYKNLCKIHENNTIDYIIAINFPVVSLFSASKFKDKFPYVNVTSYNLDIYSERKHRKSSNPFQRIKYYLQVYMEDRCYKNIDRNLFNESAYNNVRFRVRRDRFKSDVIGIPVIDKPLLNVNNQNMNSYIYTGAFQKGVRRPSELFKLIEYLDDRDKSSVIISYGDYKKDIIKFCKNKSNVKFYYQLSRLKTEEYRNMSKILINVSNLDDIQIPSKIYEYMLEGKIIINIYYHESQKKLFKEYPLVYHIYYNDINKSTVDSMLQFININIDAYVKFETILAMFKENTINDVTSKLVNTY